MGVWEGEEGGLEGGRKGRGEGRCGKERKGEGGRHGTSKSTRACMLEQPFMHGQPFFFKLKFLCFFVFFRFPTFKKKRPWKNSLKLPKVLWFWTRTLKLVHTNRQTQLSLQ